MSGLAAVLLTKGYKVSGSDAKESEVLNKLREAGAEIYIGHKSENLKNVDLGDFVDIKGNSCSNNYFTFYKKRRNSFHCLSH